MLSLGGNGIFEDAVDKASPSVKERISNSGEWHQISTSSDGKDEGIDSSDDAMDPSEQKPDWRARTVERYRDSFRSSLLDMMTSVTKAFQKDCSKLVSNSEQFLSMLLSQVTQDENRSSDALDIVEELTSCMEKELDEGLVWSVAHSYIGVLEKLSSTFVEGIYHQLTIR